MPHYAREYFQAVPVPVWNEKPILSIACSGGGEGIFPIQIDSLIRQKLAVHAGHVELKYYSDYPPIARLSREKAKTHAKGVDINQF